MKISGHAYLVGGCALLVSSLVSAYDLLDPKRTWENSPTYIVDDRGMTSINDGDGGITATLNAITSDAAWNGAGADNVVNAAVGDVTGFTLGDGIPMLNFQDPTGQCTGSCLAGTFTGFYERVGRGRNQKYHIYDADIVTNSNYDWTSAAESDGCSNEFFIEGVQVHEIGHGLGLGHTDVSGTTMYPSVAACNNGPATIENDDIAGLCALYGCDEGGSNSCDLGQVGDSCTANGQCCSGKCRGKRGSKSCR